MAFDPNIFKVAFEKVQQAAARLNTLIDQGAVKKDIDDQRAVVAEVVEQLKQVVGVSPMPPTA